MVSNECLMWCAINIIHYKFKIVKFFHLLRHTFATRALELEMDVKSLSEILSHKNATIILNRYSHSLLEHKIEMINKLGENLNI